MGAKPSLPKIPPPSQWGGAISNAFGKAGNFFKGVVRPLIPSPPPPPPPPPWYPDALPTAVPLPAPPIGLSADQQTTFTKYLNDYLKSITNNINKEFSNSNTILSDLVNTNLAEITDLTSKVDAQNKQIDKQTRTNYNKTNKVTDVRTQYSAAEIDIIKSQNYYLLIVYYIVIIIFAIILFITKPDTIYINIAIIFIMIIYPLFITQIESVIIFIIYWLYSLISGNPLTSNIYLS